MLRRLMCDPSPPPDARHLERTDLPRRGRFSHGSARRVAAPKNDDGGFSWRLGESIRAELRNINTSLGLGNVFGNVALCMPIGWLVAVLPTRRPILVGTPCALLFSTSVEVWQMVSGSFGDVDDLVLNGLGGFLGAGAASVLRSLGHGP